MATSGHTDAVVIFGSGRSGTTWVQDALADANRYCTVFEPLHPDEVRDADRYANLYVPPGSDNPDLKRFIHRILTERVAPLWTRMRVRRERMVPWTDDASFIRALRNLRVTYLRLYKSWLQDRRIRHRPRIVKFIRGNLLAEWLVTEFGVPGAVVVRHPCAVLASVIRRTGDEWSVDAMRMILRRYLEQEALVSRRLADIAAPLSKLSSIAGVHTAIWCIENGEILARDKSCSLHVCYYEDLVCNRDDAWTRLTASLGLEHVPEQQILTRPSQQAGYPLLQNFSTERLLTGWTERLDSGQTDEVAAVLQLFGIKEYSTDDPMPIASAAKSPSGPRRAERKI